MAELIRERDNYAAHYKRHAEEIKALSKTCDVLEHEWRTSDEKLEELTEELERVRKTAEDRFLSGQVMAKQLVQAEGRITELLEEIRMHDGEKELLRDIIVQAMRAD
jgi:chromosome segregation ATPase